MIKLQMYHVSIYQTEIEVSIKKLAINHFINKFKVFKNNILITEIFKMKMINQNKINNFIKTLLGTLLNKIKIIQVNKFSPY